MALARYKELCIDAVDARQLAPFWSAALGLKAADIPAGNHLVGATSRHGLWVNTVPESKTVKHRVHLDVHGRSVAEYERLGATVVDAESFHWTVMADPEGGEFCVFVRQEVPAYRLYEVVVDSADPASIARWWGDVFGAAVVHDERGFSWVHQIPGAPFESIDFVPVPEPKVVKNRIHWDVDASDADRLVAAGATGVRARDEVIGWTVMADLEGNEFCVFAP